MAKARMSAGLVASIAVLGSLAIATATAAPPTVAQMLNFRPKQEAVVCTTPTPQEQDRCKVELVKNGRVSGWILKDERGEPLRRYLDTNGDNKIDVWSYYQKGVEVYRETDSNFNDKVDQYRWLHSAGCKWGVDPVEDGKIKNWRVISPEEVSQEVLQAILKRDFNRLQALMVNEPELKALELPAAEANRIRESLKKAPAKFVETYGKLGAMEKVRWDHLELATPQCIPADVSGAKQDIIRYTNGSIVYQVGESTAARAEGIQIGELMLVGAAWRLVDAPAPGLSNAQADPDTRQVTSKELEGYLGDLQKHDASQPKSDASPAVIVSWNLKRADILEKMVTAKDTKADDRDQWYRQVADCLSVAAQNSSADKAPYLRLTALRDKLVKEDVKGNLAGYFVYAEIMASYSADLNNPKLEGPKVQKELLDKLAKYIQDYPKAENSPDALLQLGMISELMNEEAQAKKWYDMFVKNFPNHPQTPKIAGAVRRLELDGKELELAGTTLAGSPLDVKSLKGKVVVVYYWASWNAQCVGDLEKLKDLHTKYATKGLEVVCVNLDETAAAAKSFLQGKQAPATHLFEDGGMTSKFGTNYGIMVLPTMFLAGKDAKVASRTVQIGSLEDEIKKALDK